MSLQQIKNFYNTLSYFIEILYKILFEAKNYLTEDGEMWIVVNKNQGAKSLCKDLEKEYKVEIINKNKGFYIIKSKLK